MKRQNDQIRLLALVLAGGKGSRMDVLTDHRVKPALPFAGSYRLIDIPLSNLVHSRFTDVWIIEQYRPHALNEQLANGRPWDLDRTHGGLRVLPPYEGGQSENDGMARGNADAIHQHLHLIKDFAPDIIVILSADHVYKMNIGQPVQHLLDEQADAVLVTTKVSRQQASRFGVVETNAEGRVAHLHYKPDTPASNIVTTEIFVFRAQPLFDTMEAIARRAELEDYGHQLIPHMIDQYRVHAYRYEGYWRDVGTIDSYWQVHMDLVEDAPAFPLDDLNWPLLTRDPQRPPARIFKSARVDHGLIAPGCQIRGQVTRSVLSPGVVVMPGAKVYDSVILEDVRVERNAHIHSAIVDKQAIVGEGAEIGGSRSEKQTGASTTLIGLRARVPAGVRMASGERFTGDD